MGEGSGASPLRSTLFNSYFLCMVNEQDQMRTAVCYRVGVELGSNTPLNDRVYASVPKRSRGNISKLHKVLRPYFDTLVLHDGVDGCVLVNLNEELYGQRITSFPCRINHAKLPWS